MKILLKTMALYKATITKTQGLNNGLVHEKSSNPKISAGLF